MGILMERNHAIFVEVNWLISIYIYAYAHDLSGFFICIFGGATPDLFFSSKNISDLRLLKKDVSLEPKG